MQAFITRYQHAILATTGILTVLAAFYTGFLEGKNTATTQPVTLACNDNVLSNLSIPVEALARGVVAHASDTSTALQSMPGGQPTNAPLGKYVGSKNSTKYYAPSCGAVKRIKPENYMWFDSAEDAQIQGYTPGKC